MALSSKPDMCALPPSRRAADRGLSFCNSSCDVLAEKYLTNILHMHGDAHFSFSIKNTNSHTYNGNQLLHVSLETVCCFLFLYVHEQVFVVSVSCSCSVWNVLLMLQCCKIIFKVCTFPKVNKTTCCMTCSNTHLSRLTLIKFSNKSCVLTEFLCTPLICFVFSWTEISLRTHKYLKVQWKCRL